MKAWNRDTYSGLLSEQAIIAIETDAEKQARIDRIKAVESRLLGKGDERR